MAVRRVAAVAVLMVVAAAIAAVSGSGGTQQYTVSGVLDAAPTGEQVRVTGTVTRTLDDYTADSGNVYQQFYVTDGEAELLVFCNVEGGRAPAAVNATVTATGTFKEFAGEYEIFTDCDRVRRQ